MSENSIVASVLLLIIVGASYQGFRNAAFFDKYSFQVDKILIGKDFQRLLTSGFLHIGWIHLAFNLIALYSFSLTVERLLGISMLTLIYFSSLMVGNLLALYFHRQHGDYTAVGASGAVSGVVYANIFLHPYGEIGFIFIPIGIPSWFFALAFVLLSIYGIQTQWGNIGHEAHLGGALTGGCITLALQPTLLQQYPLIILGILLPSITFLYWVIRKPEYLLVPNLWKKKAQMAAFGKRLNTAKTTLSTEEELNQLLEKISEQGLDSLTIQEKKQLDKLSQKK